MGQIRSFVQDLDPSKPAEAEMRQHIETLARLAASKAEFFELQVATSLRTAGSEDNQTVPVEAVLNSASETHAYSSKSSGAISDTAVAALRSFCGGTKDDIVTGVGALITNGLATFLGDASASESTLKKYYVMTEGFSVIRVDLMAWQLKIESSGIQNRLEKVSAFVLVKSAVDLQKIRFNTFLNLYQRQLNSSSFMEFS